MRTHLLALACVAFLSACVNSAVAQSRSNNPDIDVETLFTHEGCTVYRFHDASFHYYVRCQGTPTVATMSVVSCGKNCTRPEEIPTVASVASGPGAPAKP